MSQGDRWQQCRKLLLQLTLVAMEYDKDGIEIHFLNNDLERSDENFAEDVEEFLDNVPVPSGSSRLSDKLDQLICEYRGKLKEYVDSRPARRWRTKAVPKKSIYVVITDGENTDAQVVGNIVLKMAQYLDDIDAPNTQFGIEFVQIGEGKTFFDWLDRDMYINQQVRDIVRTTTYKGEDLNKAQVGAILLGSVNGNGE
ncbi:hypothetical protein BDV93DRAFT_447144 [Ceratobasidium sp. AG-I]|nr:hypothetical protein BDV93DRAFT_447144 [Ceratobasidium sp. AG-I]